MIVSSIKGELSKYFNNSKKGNLNNHDKKAMYTIKEIFRFV